MVEISTSMSLNSFETSAKHRSEKNMVHGFLLMDLCSDLFLFRIGQGSVTMEILELPHGELTELNRYSAK